MNYQGKWLALLEPQGLKEILSQEYEATTYTNLYDLTQWSIEFFSIMLYLVLTALHHVVEASWNVLAHAQKPDFVFRAKRTSPFKSAGDVSSVDYWQPRCAHQL